MKKLTLLFALSTLTMQAFSALMEKKMKYILIIFATFILSGCFDPTFDASSTDSRRDSYSKMLESLPESERSKFDELVVYYLQEYEIAGEVNQNSMDDFDGLNADDILKLTEAHRKKVDEFIDEEVKSAEVAKSVIPASDSGSNYMKVTTSSKMTELGGGLKAELQYVHIQSLIDQLEVQSLVANRGNCRVIGISTNKKQLPAKVKYGETFYVLLNNDCDVIELEITTDQGSVTLSE